MREICIERPVGPELTTDGKQITILDASELQFQPGDYPRDILLASPGDIGTLYRSNRFELSPIGEVLVTIYISAEGEELHILNDQFECASFVNC